MHYFHSVTSSQHPHHCTVLAWPGWNGGMHTNNNNTSSVHPSLRRMEVGGGQEGCKLSRGVVRVKRHYFKQITIRLMADIQHRNPEYLQILSIVLDIDSSRRQYPVYTLDIGGHG